jgi:hypothetical protein
MKQGDTGRCDQTGLGGADKWASVSPCDEDDEDSNGGSEGSQDDDSPEPVEIEFDGITERVVALPMPAGRYAYLTGLDDGRFMLVKYPVKSEGRVGLDAPYYEEDDDDSGSEAGAYTPPLFSST